MTYAAAWKLAKHTTGRVYVYLEPDGSYVMLAARRTSPDAAHSLVYSMFN
jgi:hypothetical protein